MKGDYSLTEKTGLLLKAISGFYYVLPDGENEIYECKAKGAFRNENQCPLVGDHVTLEVTGDKQGIVSKISLRKNEFTRPPMANLDKLFLVCSMKDPAPSLLVLDKLITVCEYKEIEPILIFTKIDLKTSRELEENYQRAGYVVISLSNNEQEKAENIDRFAEVFNCLKGSVSAFAGNTGVGKSSLLNNIFPSLSLSTGETSKKLGRGKHTTRQVELFPIENINGYVADTPGFGSMEMLQYEIIAKEQLQYCFREFAPYIEKCRFTGCSHTVEKGCALLEALEKGEICQSRHDSYCALYDAAKQFKQWEH